MADTEDFDPQVDDPEDEEEDEDEDQDDGEEEEDEEAEDEEEAEEEEDEEDEAADAPGLKYLMGDIKDDEEDAEDAAHDFEPDDDGDDDDEIDDGDEEDGEDFENVDDEEEDEEDEPEPTAKKQKVWSSRQQILAGYDGDILRVIASDTSTHCVSKWALNQKEKLKSSVPCWEPFSWKLAFPSWYHGALGRIIPNTRGKIILSTRGGNTFSTLFIKNEQQRVNPVLECILLDALEHYKESYACRLSRRGKTFVYAYDVGSRASKYCFSGCTELPI